MKTIVLSLAYSLLVFVNSNSQTITTIAGNGLNRYAGDGGPAISASISPARQLCIDNAGNIFVADFDNHVVRKITTSGIISTIAGTGIAGYSGDGGPAAVAMLNNPDGIALDASGNLYISEWGNQDIRKVGKGGIITTFAGTHTGGYNGDDIPALSADFNLPSALFFDNEGSLVFADEANCRIRKITLDGIIHSVAGTGLHGFNGDGTAIVSAVFAPVGLTGDKAGNLYIADMNNYRVRKLSTDGKLTTIAGNGGNGYSGDGGNAIDAQLTPAGIAVDVMGNIYISDTYNNRIRRITTDGTITTVVGNGVAGFSGDGGNPISAMLNLPWGLFMDKHGILFFADRLNYRLRKVTLISPPAITSFTPTLAGKGIPVTIIGTNLTGASSVSFGGIKAASFTVNSSTKITAKVGLGGDGPVSVTTAGGTASKDGFMFCAAPLIKITTSTGVNICKGTPVTFIATITNEGSRPKYQWRKNGIATGINSAAYTDSLLKTGDSITCIFNTITACAVSASATSPALIFKVSPIVAPTVTITPSILGPVCAGTKMTFSSEVTNVTKVTYRWYKNNVAAGGNSSSAYADNRLADKDSVWCVITAVGTCLASPINRSNTYVYNVISKIPPSLTISNTASNGPICPGAPVVFTAIAGAPLTNPIFEWKRNHIVVGGNSAVYIDSTAANGDSIRCSMTVTLPCTAGMIGTSTAAVQLSFITTPIPAQPSAINGSGMVTAGQMGLLYGITKTTGLTYNWTVPDGTTIASGQGTYRVTVNWSSAPGNISVTASNNCGASTASIKKVTIIPGLQTQMLDRNKSTAQGSMRSLRVYPNPVTNTAAIEFTAMTIHKYQVQLINGTGQVVTFKTGITLKGLNTVTFAMEGMAAAMYYIKLVDAEYGTITTKLFKGK